MSITIITVATLFLSHAAHIQKSFKNHRFSRFSQFANHISHHVIYSTKRPLTPKQGGIPTTSNNYPLDKNGYAIPILFDAINFGSNKAIPADSPTASPEDVMNNVLSAFCSNSSDITISQQEYTNNTGSPEKAMSVPALPPVSCAPTQQVAVSIPQNQPAPTETAVCPPVIERPKAANAATIANHIAATGKIRIYQEHIYWYANGWYHLLQTGELRRLMRALCTSDIEKHSSKRVFEDIEVFLLSNSKLLAEPPGNHSLLCIQNGIYDMTTNTISPHTPAYFFTHCLNVSLPTLCHGTPHFDNFIGFITGNDYALQMRIWQMLGYIFACDTDGKVFFLLQGVSNSGKSVLLELLRSMFNPEAVSTLDLYRLGDRFSGAALIEKKLNICGDLPNRTLSAQAVATLKQITGRDLMTVEEKYKPLATMAPAINLVFASNFPIREVKCSQFPSCVDFTGFNCIQNCVYCYYLSFFSKIALKHRPHYFHI